MAAFATGYFCAWKGPAVWIRVLTPSSRSRAANPGSLASTTTARSAGRLSRAARAAALPPSRPATRRRTDDESEASDSEIRSPKKPYPPNTRIVCIGPIVYATAMAPAPLVGAGVTDSSDSGPRWFREAQYLVGVGLDDQAEWSSVGKRQHGAVLNGFGRD